MANLSSNFSDYNKAIKLADIDRTQLLIVRDELRRRMRDGYDLVSAQIKHQHKIEFQSQGSFVMDTIIRPMRDDYDLDDGIYFIGSKKPAQRPSTQEFHEWVRQSIDRGHDDIEKITDKATCVRVQYKKGFHIDIPIYYAEFFDTPDLAHKEKGWVLSNPIEFIDWFERKISSGFQKAFIYESRMYSEFARWTADIRKQDHQLRRIVRYLKAWGDLRREEMPCGLIMTILAANHYSAHDRDDIALKETLVNIEAQLARKFECLRPTTPVGENLLEGYKNREAFLKYLQRFIENAKAALQEPDADAACVHWQKSLGDRFKCQPKPHASNNSPSSATAGLVIGASSSKPWVS
jgi:hypothetical protein